MRILWDVDIEIDCAVPSAAAPLVDGAHIIVAGGEHALLARVHRDTGTVENALFTSDTDVDVSVPVSVPRDEDVRGHCAFASIDRPRLHLNVTVVDEHMRVVRTRDISADDPETPELLVDGRVTHFSAHHEPGRGPFYVVAVREPDLPEVRRPQRIVRCVWDDLTPRWSSRTDDVRGAFGDCLVTRSVHGSHPVRCIAAADGTQRWDAPDDGHRPAECVGVGAGVVSLARPEEVEVYETLPARIEVLDIATARELDQIDMPIGVAVRDVVPSGSFFTSVWRRGHNAYALLHARADAEGARALFDVAHAPILIDDAHALAGPELIEWHAGAPPTRLSLGLTGKGRGTIRDDVVYIRDGKRLLAVALD